MDGLPTGFSPARRRNPRPMPIKTVLARGFLFDLFQAGTLGRAFYCIERVLLAVSQRFCRSLWIRQVWPVVFRSDAKKASSGDSNI
ncbi:hypothetical protein MCP1_40180 [Candidatus Terasakiella magnetica]|nr:hypothetical protein MCP1_40180 [Candidatus Terasakiella magnetica]